MLAKKFRSKEWSLMNYGYAPSAGEALLALNNEDEINRYPIQLYHYLAATITIKELNVLEVGSRSGGGAAYLSNYLQPEHMIG